MSTGTVNNPYHIATLIEKMNSLDKDYRFMAINDLISELQNDSLRLDSDSERKLTKEVLKLLEDQNLEVQNQAVKCLSYLVRKIKEPNVVNIIRDLTMKMMQINNDNMCGICAIGLKTIIIDTPVNDSEVTTILIREIPKPLIELMDQGETSGIRQMEAFDIMSEVINKFGSRLPVHDLKSVFVCCQQQLFNERLSVRKRALACVGSFLSVTGSEFFDEFLKFILDRVSRADPKRTKQEDMKTLVQCIGILTKQPSRAGMHIHNIYQTLLSLINFNDEIQDLVIQTFEILISKCSVEMFKHFDKILSMLLRFITYDPNYHYDEDVDMHDYDDEENEEENDEFLYSDDDDLSWKVRRSSVKCLETCILTYPNMLNEIIKLAGPVLIDRFNEREETVKREIFQCFLTLLKQIGCNSKLYRRRSTNDMRPNTQILSLLQSMLDRLRKQSRSKNWLIRQGIFSILKEATIAVPNCFNKSVGTVINIALFSLNEKNANANLKFDAVNLLVELISTHPDADFSDHFLDLTKVLNTFLNDAFYRLSLESLDLALVLITRAKKLDHVRTILQIYPQLFALLRTLNTDFDLKEKSINTMCALLCCLGDYLQPVQVDESIRIFMERLNNELIRINVLKAFISLSKSVDIIDLGKYLPTIISTITPFLQKTDRTLRSETLKCLESFWNNYCDQLKHHTKLMVEIIQLLQSLLSDTDLQVAQSIVILCTKFLGYNCTEVKTVFWNLLMGSILKLLKSPLLHGTTLNALISLMKRISIDDVYDFKVVTSKILGTIVTSTSIDCISREAYPNVAACIAELVINSNSASKKELYLQEFYESSIIRNKSDCSSHQYVSIMILGEIGSSIDMSHRNYVLETMMQIFECGHETLKSAAAYSLGKMAICRLDIFIPYILGQIQQNPNCQYYLLHSLREIITTVSSNSPDKYNALNAHFETIWNLLIQNSNSQEEGVRNIVSECIGKLTLMNPVSLIPKLKEILANSGPGTGESRCLTRATIVTAVKHTIVPEPHPIDAHLTAGSNMREFMRSLTDPDLVVQRAGLITLNTVIHNKPDIVRDFILEDQPVGSINCQQQQQQQDNIIGWLYDATKVRPELIREVEMGPFKHLEDDGLDLRKCAFECISNLLDNCIEEINIMLFLDRIEEGLRDNGEIKLLCYPMLTKISKYYPNKFLDKMPSIFPAIRNLLNSRPKHDAVKQEQEKLDEQKRAAIKFLVYVYTNEHLNKSKPFVEFISAVISGPLKTMFIIEQEQAMQKQRF